MPGMKLGRCSLSVRTCQTSASGADSCACALISTLSPWRRASISTSCAACAAPVCAAVKSARAIEEVRHGCTVLTYHSALAQHHDGITVGPREAALRSLAPRQPCEGDV